jgi:hypothetical protein
MKKILFFSFLSPVIFTWCQKSFSNQQHAWISYIGNHKLSNKFSLHTEYQWRRNDYFNNWQQSLTRVGIDYHVNPNLSVTAGYAWILTFPYGEQPILNEFNEHRIWQQLTFKNKFESKFRIIDVQHRYRLEQRLIENYIKSDNGEIVKGENIFRQRIRYRVQMYIPLNKKSMTDKIIFLNVNDEIFLGFGEGIGKNVLDQNRFNAALGWKFNSNFNVQFGYLNQYVIKSDGINIERNHTFLTSINYNMRLTKKNGIN